VHAQTADSKATRLKGSLVSPDPEDLTAANSRGDARQLTSLEGLNRRTATLLKRKVRYSGDFCHRQVTSQHAQRNYTKKFFVSVHRQAEPSHRVEAGY
jgi:hypothetical protein